MTTLPAASGEATGDGTLPLSPVRTVEPGWIDYNGHMNVAWYGAAFDELLDGFLEKSFGLGPGLAAARKQGPYVLQNHIHYLRELLAGERFRVRFRLLDADGKRLHVFLEMLRDGDGARVATSEQMVLNVDLVRRRSTPWPAEIRTRIKALRDAHAALPRPAEAGAPLGIRRRGDPGRGGAGAGGSLPPGTA